jgi:membrane-bound serine protease (ClpP class)
VTVDPTVAGVVLLILGVALIGLEIHLPSYGIFALLGLSALAGSGVLFFGTDSDEVEVSVPVVVAVAAILVASTVFAARKVSAASREPVHTGWEEMIGAEGEVREALDPEGQVFVSGALWRARVAGGGGRVERGSRVRVESVEGLTLQVRPASEEGDS